MEGRRGEGATPEGVKHLETVSSLPPLPGREAAPASTSCLGALSVACDLGWPMLLFFINDKDK